MTLWDEAVQMCGARQLEDYLRMLHSIDAKSFDSFQKTAAFDSVDTIL